MMKADDRWRARPMAATLERPLAPARRRLDVDAYYRMAEAGILAPDDRVELIEGDVIDMVPIGSEHAGQTMRLVRVFAGAVAREQVLLSVQGPLRLDAINEPQPDLALLRPRADSYRRSHPSAVDVLLVIEIAGSSLDYDRGVKRDLYARHLVPEYWIVDLVGRAIEVFRAPTSGGYTETLRVAGGRLRPVLVADTELDVGELFGLHGD
ncbi:MAG: Uma2 family endonuclease [Geminicoccaceae bacterium]|nr:MAG: Uma2 family endonuclease [Geminicoccaceae bacterium]